MMLYKYRWWAVAAIGLSIFLTALDATIVALALPLMKGFFQLSESQASLIILSYTVPLTVLILPCGTLIDRFPPLPTFLVAVLGFGLGSVTCGLATNIALLILGRVLQGSFGALIATQGLAVAAAVVEPQERGRAMGLIGSLAPLGGIAGPGIGGQLLAHWSWQVIFFVNVPICVLAASLGLLSLRHISAGGEQRGAGTNVRMMGLLLRSRPFRWGLLGFLSNVTCAGVLYYILPFDLHDIQHLASSSSGLILLCIPLGMGTTGLLGGYLTDRYGARPFTLIGSGLLLLGVVLLFLDLAHVASPFSLTWHLLIVGMGMGLFNGPNQTLLMSSSTREAMGAASALSNLSARLGSIIGPLLPGILWAFLPDSTLRMSGGGIILVALALFSILCAWLVQPQAKPEQAKKDVAPAKKASLVKQED